MEDIDPKQVSFNRKYTRVLANQPGWYRGDFHTHTHSSDGVYPADILAGIAQAEELDFISITDHNTFAGLLELSSDLDILIIPGIEVTFHKGHFNVFGLEGWYDWMQEIYSDHMEVPELKSDKAMTELIQEISTDGLLISINHACLKPWDWQFEDTDLRQIHCLELWNDLYWPDNATANVATVKMWTEWLNAGYRITAIGGSDYHYPPRPEENKFGERLGMPATYVYAQELSTAGILDAVRKRRAYVTKGPQLDFKARVDGRVYEMGADLGAVSGVVDFLVTFPNQLVPVNVQLVKNGAVIAREQVEGKDIRLQLQHEIEGTSFYWFRLDVTDSKGDILAITNPFFTGPIKEPERRLYKDFLP